MNRCHESDPIYEHVLKLGGVPGTDRSIRHGPTGSWDLAVSAQPDKEGGRYRVTDRDAVKLVMLRCRDMLSQIEYIRARPMRVPRDPTESHRRARQG